ncbi:MAG: excisionase family DNA-binding protein [Gemmatimonadales bacterium]|nr:excisionase family DNA-binding protein [Gemmatimonadales bacterium]
MGSLLRTGEVAKLCGVTPDAVLKWIKKGKLPATRTAGGHYRVSREDCVALGLCDSNGDDPVAASGERAEGGGAVQRCWEYFGGPGAPPESCLNCLVYQARAQYCYRLAELGKKAGHGHDFCKTDCMDCPFYRACHGLATTVLVITRDEALTRRLEKQVDADKVSLRFARSGYESSTLIGTFRPAVVVMDSELPEVSGGSLLDSIVNDDRIPGVRVFVASREGEVEAVESRAVLTLAAPITAERIEQLAASVASTGSRAAGDAA